MYDTDTDDHTKHHYSNKRELEQTAPTTVEACVFHKKQNIAEAAFGQSWQTGCFEARITLDFVPRQGYEMSASDSLQLTSQTVDSCNTVLPGFFSFNFLGHLH